MKRTLSLLLLGVAVIALTACSNGPTTAATVNGERISQSDLQRGIKALASSQLYRDGVNAQLSASPDSVKLEAGSSSAPASVTRQWLTTLVQSAAVRQLADQRGVKATADDLTTARNELSGAQAQTAQQQQGGALFRSIPTWLQDQIARSLALQLALRRAIPQPVVSAAELRSTYDQVLADCPTKRLVGHILVKTEQEAQDVAARLQKGESFADVASAVSIDTGSAPQAGLLTCEQSSQWAQLDETFQAAAQATPTGSVSKPVQTQFGWHVIEVLDPTRENAAPLVLALAKANQQDAVSAAILRHLAKARLWVNPRYGVLDRSANGGFQIVSPAVTPKSRPSSTPSPSAPAGATSGASSSPAAGSSTTTPTSTP